jgi:receptor protein-tyrosine kinase
VNARLQIGPGKDRGPVLPGDADRASPAQRLAALAPSARPGRSLVMAHARQDPRGEEIRALRTSILLRRDPQVHAEAVALVSPHAGEGRTQLAAELAISFAQLGRPTLLVDADLRNPRQHLLFGADRELGLAQALDLGTPPWIHAVEGIPDMFLVAAGSPPANPLELLLDVRFAALVGEWRQRFEFIVLDTAPVTPFSDALAVATVAGSVIALARADRTPHATTRDMLRRLAATRADILGAVISRF